MTSWMQFIKDIQKKNNLTYKEAMIKASSLYNKGGTVKSSGYIRKLLTNPETSKNKRNRDFTKEIRPEFDIDKMVNKNKISNWIKTNKLKQPAIKLSWREFVKKIQQEQNLSYNEALKTASPLYK